MSFNGSGVYTAPASSFPAVASTLIESAKFNAIINDIATALTNCVTKDGQTTTTVSVPFAAGIKVDTIAENTSATGVTIDGVLLKDSQVTTDVILEKTAAAGVTIDDVLLKDGGATLKDSVTQFQDDGDATKQMRFQLSGITTGNVRTLTVPDASTTLVGTDATQTLTNKTISGGTVTGITDLAVADGGTGASTFTDGGVLIGNGTGAIQATTAGTSGHVLTSNGAGVDPTFQALPPTGVSLGTPQASTSGTSIDFTSIPAGTKKITVTLSGVSTNGTSNLIVQIGDSGGIETSSYAGAAALDNSSITSYTAGFGLDGTTRGAAGVCHGELTLTLVDSSTFTWVASGHTYNGTNLSNCVGSKSLSAELDRVRLTTVNGTDTFDAGKINIAYSS